MDNSKGMNQEDIEEQVNQIILDAVNKIRDFGITAYPSGHQAITYSRDSGILEAEYTITVEFGK